MSNKKILPENGESPIPVVGIGASAGGLDAFTQLVTNLPVDTGMAFVLVQHLDPQHESRLTELLSRATRMPVLEVTDGILVAPDRVYIIPPNTELRLEKGRLHLTARVRARGPHLPIDAFFRSLAQDEERSAVGVVLSGTGSDGTLGLEEIKAAGGITFAQDEASARHPGMPLSAVAAGCVDFVLPPDDIARELARISRHPYFTPEAPDEGDGLPVKPDDPFGQILGLVHSATGVDFSHYRPTTIRRRTMRRMTLHKQEQPADYVRLLLERPEEVSALFQDLLINVTRFFRDPEVFEVLKKRVYPELLKTRGQEGPIRAWVVGCSSGEEAYSVAMSLLEFLDDKPNPRPIQIFATDLSDTASLEKARAGLYPESIEADVSQERLLRFFTRVEGGGYRISKAIRDLCVFARQNVVADPPFSRMDLITCRNVLIYMNAALQNRIIHTFHYALSPNGFLLLGPSESVGRSTDLFEAVDKKHKAYRRKSAAGRLPHYLAEGYQVGGRHKAEPGAVTLPEPTPAEWQKESDRILLSRYAPASVLVNQDLEILQFRGRTGAYLEPSPGEASLNLLRMARSGLGVELRRLTEEAKQQGVAVGGRMVLREGRSGREVDIEVMPIRLPGSGEACFLILFSEASEAPAATAGEAPVNAPQAEAEELDGLRRELAGAREYLQTLTEQYEAANEELRSANEESLSSNEELQSTNEEIATAKEELQSTNEELITLNEELQNRNLELNQLNDDLANLLGSVNIPIVMLSGDLRIRRYTPAAAKVMNLIPTDIGRPIGHLQSSVNVPDLEALLLDVIATVQPREREVQDDKGHWHSLRAWPYRTSDHRIDGAVLSLVDINAVKQGQEQMRKAGDYARSIVDTVREPLLILDKDLRVCTANRSYYSAFRVTPEETEGRFVYELGGRRWDVPALRRLLEQVALTGSAFEELVIEQDFPASGRHTLQLNARRIEPPGGVGSPDSLILVAAEDITERSFSEAALRETELRYRRLFEAAKDGILLLDVTTGQITDANPFMTELLGYPRGEFLGKELWQIGLLRDEEASRAAVQELQGKGYLRYDDLPLETKGGGCREVELVSNVYREDGHSVIQCNVRDVTERKEAERALLAADRAKTEFLAMLAHELRNPLAPALNAIQIMRDRPSREKGAHARDVIERQIRAMARLIEDLLDVSRITGGKIELRSQPMDLRDVLSTVVEDLQPEVAARGQELTFSFPDEPLPLEADSQRLEQVFTNLLYNAIRYTPTGGRIRVSATIEGVDAAVRVRDTGIGIAPELLPHVFDLFAQGARGPERSHGGLGVGLTIVQRLVELHGGTVEAHSEGPGLGSEFTVRLPLRQEELTGPKSRKDRTPARLNTGTPERPGAAGSDRRLLVVDDNQDGAETLTELAAMWGWEARTALDGASGLEAARAQRPSIIILDLSMPGMDGYEVARRVRADPDIAAATLIALTGLGQDVDRNGSRDAGFDYHLVKPVDPEAIRALLEQLSPRARTAGDRADQGDGATKSSISTK